MDILFFSSSFVLILLLLFVFDLLCLFSLQLLYFLFAFRYFERTPDASSYAQPSCRLSVFASLSSHVCASLTILPYFSATPGLFGSSSAAWFRDTLCL